jgi:hypothetical protein
LVFIALGRRELLHVGMTANQTGTWVWRQLIDVTPWARNHVICSVIAMQSMAAIFRAKVAPKS